MLPPTVCRWNSGVRAPGRYKQCFPGEHSLGLVASLVEEMQIRFYFPFSGQCFLTASGFFCQHLHFIGTNIFKSHSNHLFF